VVHALQPELARLPFRTNNQLRHLWRRKAEMSDGDDTNGPNGETPDTAALYIGSLTDELAKIARRNGLHFLGYILEMARLEADQIAKG
jgi:hypothetical protein